MTKVDKEIKEILDTIQNGVDLGAEDDLEYFRKKIIRGLERKHSIIALKKTINQLELLEDAIVVYKIAHTFTSSTESKYDAAMLIVE